MSKKDIIPTPSHPMKSWNMLLTVTKMIMAMRKMSRYLKKRFMKGSVCIYQDANLRIDQVTYRAMGVKMME